MSSLKVGLIGCGAIGRTLADAIKKGKAGNVELVALYDMDRPRAEETSRNLGGKIRVVENPETMLRDKSLKLVIEAASQEAARKLIPKALEAGKNVMIMSVGVLADEEFLKQVRSLANLHSVKVYIPSGAIAGLDAVKGASIENVSEVTINTRKPPEALEGAPYVVQKGIDLKNLKEPLDIYEGPAEEAVKLFPANVNVSATLSLAGVGPKKTMVRVTVDPNLKRNIHEIHVEGDFGKLMTRVENIPSPQNPKTSFLAILSAVRKLREITEPISLGT